MRACERGVATLVFIRDPYDAVVSHVELSKQTQVVEQGVEAPVQWLSFEMQLNAWCTFYRSLQSYRDRMVVAPLEMVIEDMGRIVDRINSHFGTDFDRFDHNPEAVAKVHEKQGYHSGPNKQREQLKADTRADFDAQLQTDPSLQDTLEEANALFVALTSEVCAGDR